MSQAHILIIEDDQDINTIIAKHLAKKGFKCEQAFTGTRGAVLLGSQSFDLVITDLMLPGIPGEDVVRFIRERDTAVPIIVVSARIAVSSKINLLNLGADDYLTKPFDLDELTARVEAQLRRNSVSAAKGIVNYHDWTIDCDARTLLAGGQPVPLTRTEYNVVELLITHPNKVFTKQELYELAWNEPYSVDDSTLNMHISNIRSKLKPSGTEVYVQTVWGLGFKLADVD